MTKQVFKDMVAAIVAGLCVFFFNKFLHDSGHPAVPAIAAGAAIFIRGKIMDVFRAETYEPILVSNADYLVNDSFKNPVELINKVSGGISGWSFTWLFGKQFLLQPAISIRSNDHNFVKLKLEIVECSKWHAELRIHMEYDSLLSKSARFTNFRDLMKGVSLRADANNQYGPIKKSVLNAIGIKGLE